MICMNINGQKTKKNNAKQQNENFRFLNATTERNKERKQKSLPIP